MASTNSNKMGNNGGRAYSYLNKPVLIDCNFIVDATNGLGIRSLNGSGVQNVFMHTSSSAGRGANNYLNPNPAAGYALIQLQNNYNRYAGGFHGMVAPLSGSDLAINASALTAGLPYVISSVGHATAGAVTIVPVGDTSGSLASTWFRLYDAYGNAYVIWFSVSGVGSAPSGVSGVLVQQSISTGDSAGTVGAALVVTINGLLAAQPGNLSAPSGVYSFTAAGTTTVTLTSTATNPYGPLPGGPVDGVIPTGFTFAVTKYKTNIQNWNNVGLPLGVIPAVGASFIATATGDSTGGGSSGLVQLSTNSGISTMEVIGDPNKSLGPIPMGGSPNVGGWILVKFLAPSFAGTALGSHSHDLKVIGGQAASTTNDVAVYTAVLGKEAATDATILGSASVASGGVIAASAGTPAGTMSLAVTAPAAGSIVSMSFMVEAGSILISGE